MDGNTWGSSITTTGFASDGNHFKVYWNSGYGSWYIDVASWVTGYIRTNSAVNLSDYKYLRSKCSPGYYEDNYGTVYLGISTSPSWTNYAAWSAASSKTASSCELVLDITNFSGMYFIYYKIVSTHAFTDVSIWNIRLSNS